jgi:hypothetical protein
MESATIVFTDVIGPDELHGLENMLRETFFPLSAWYTPICEATADGNGNYKATIKFMRRFRS